MSYWSLWDDDGLRLQMSFGRQRLNCPEDVHRQEIAFALSHKDVTVIPVLVDGAEMPRAEDLPIDIRSLTDQQSRELSDGRARRDVDMQLLIEDIKRSTGLKIRNGKLSKRSSKRAALKASFRMLLAMVVLSFAGWLFFYVTQPGVPLTSAETAIVVGSSAVIVLSAKGLWARLNEKRKDESV